MKVFLLRSDQLDKLHAGLMAAPERVECVIGTELAKELLRVYREAVAEDAGVMCKCGHLQSDHLPLDVLACGDDAGCCKHCECEGST